VALELDGGEDLQLGILRRLDLKAVAPKRNQHSPVRHFGGTEPPELGIVDAPIGVGLVDEITDRTWVVVDAVAPWSWVPRRRWNGSRSFSTRSDRSG
jgi:hypothetical protein